MSENIAEFPNQNQSETECDRESIFAQPRQEIIDLVNSYVDKLQSLTDDVKSLNKKKTAVFTDLKDKGFDRDAFKWVLKLKQKDEDQQRVADLTESIARQALNLPVQGELMLEAQAQLGVDNYQEAKG